MLDFRFPTRRPKYLAGALRAMAVIGFTLSPAIHAQTRTGLEPQVLTKIHAATFEVVAAKPLTDNLTYVRPLPLELLPFQERNDKYFSIGTAFSIGNNRYVTAAHVPSTVFDSVWGTPALRDSDGRVYPVDKIEKFSLPRDFVVFSVTGHPGSSSMKLNTNPRVDSMVWRVQRGGDYCGYHRLSFSFTPVRACLSQLS